MKNVIYAVLFALIFTSCGKYEEGPKASFRSRQKRIEGLWKVYKFKVNGIDSTTYFTTKFGSNLDITENKWELPRGNSQYSLSGIWNWHMFKYYTMFEVETLVNDNVQYDIQAFENDTLLTDSILSVINSDLMGPFRLGRDIQWEIMRIHNSELFMETEYNDMTYRIELTLESDH